MHTTVIIFQNENARKQLLEKGFVYTFRVKKHKTGKDWATDKRCGKKIADVMITPAAEVNSEEDLIPFANASGFVKVSDWVDAIKQKYPDVKGYLFAVSLLSLQEGKPWKGICCSRCYKAKSEKKKCKCKCHGQYHGLGAKEHHKI